MHLGRRARRRDLRKYFGADNEAKVLSIAVSVWEMIARDAGKKNQENRHWVTGY